LCGSQGVCAAVTAERSHCTRTGPVSIDPVHPSQLARATVGTGQSHTLCGRHASVGVSANHCVRPLCGSQGVCAAVTAERSVSSRTGPVRCVYSARELLLASE
jgi:hypothetical protein